jgi:hypothetical protein
VFTIVLGWIGWKVNEVASLREQLKKANDEQIASQLAAMTEKMSLHLTPLFKEVDRICGELKEGEARFRDLDSRDHALETRFIDRLNEVKDAMRKECASGQDLDRLRSEVGSLTRALVRTLNIPLVSQDERRGS